MSAIDGSKLMFDETSVQKTTALLPRLLRIIFFGRGITHDEYVTRYHRYLNKTEPWKDRKERSQKIASDRKFLAEDKKLTFNLLSNALSAMDIDIECISFRVRDHTTGETLTFSTDQTSSELKEMVEKEKSIGVQSLV